MEQHDSTPRPRRGRFLVAGLAVGLVLAGLGVASAQTESPSTTPPANEEAPPSVEAVPVPPPGVEAPPDVRWKFRLGRGPQFGHGPHFGGGPHFKFGGPFGSIHSESTTQLPDGTFRTMATQTGEVTSVSTSKLEVKSADGYSRTYAVDEDTFVNAGRDGIANVKEGNEVHVMAVVEDGTAKARQVADTTNLRRFREQWGPKQAKPKKK